MATSGPFARDIDGPNLLDTALSLLREHDAKLQLGTVLLEKNLPVAAGLGGGSADAAALLRAVRRANPERAGAVAWHALAARLGADVPVCLAGTPALISGIGDKVEPLGAAHGLPADGRRSGQSPAALADARRCTRRWPQDPPRSPVKPSALPRVILRSG